MISVEQAQKLIERRCRPLKPKAIPVKEAIGFTIAEDIRSPIHLPIADNSAMDGFVFRARDTRNASRKKPLGLFCSGVIRAGDSRQGALKPGEALRIMTGAFTPKGGDSVLPQERATVREGKLWFNGPAKKGTHVRKRGEEVKIGDLVIERHSKIHPATIGILSTLGINRVKVFERPSVSIITTGSELVSPGTRLKPGQIYDSNSSMITSALHRMGMAPIHVRRVGDEAKALKSAIQKELKASDVLILMGGVSVGDYDFVKNVLQKLGVKTIFWRVSQKPGKPLYFGMQGHKLVFGLPGNPASVFTCFYQYVYPALRRLSGSSDPYLRRAHAVVESEIRSDEKRLVFLKAKMNWKKQKKQVKPLHHQGSHMISSLHDADSFIVVPPKQGSIKKGTRVAVDLLPHTSE